MNLLKYLDVLIGLAVVMVLLSPLVTAITQILLWTFRRRSRTLKAGIRDLVLQLGQGSLQIDRIDVGVPERVPGTINVSIKNGTETRAAAIAPGARGTFTGDIPIADGEIALQTDALADTHFSITRWCRVIDVNSNSTDGQGKTTLSYVSPAADTAHAKEAAVRIVDVKGAGVEATVQWKIIKGNYNGLADTLTSSANNPAVFAVPGGNQPESALELELTVADSRGKRLENHTVQFAFRNDLEPVDAVVDRKGAVSVSASTGFDASDAEELAKRILMHPMIASPGMWTGKYYMGDVIEREELIRILLEFAADEGSGAGHVKDRLRKTLRTVLASNGIADPAQTLVDIRTRAQELEHSDPGVAAHVRQTMAIIEKAKSDFVGKINNWFDQVMVRVTNRYTFWARVFTTGAAFFVALGLQFDSIDLIKRLSVDDKLRDSLFQEAQAYQARVDKLQGNTPTSSSSTPTAPSAPSPTTSSTAEQQFTLDAAKAQLEDVEHNLAMLRSGQLTILPEQFPWQSRARRRLTVNDAWRPEQIPTELELVLGSRRYIVRPQWSDVPADQIGMPETVLPLLQHAIARTGAPVDVTLEKSADAELIVQGDGTSDFTLAGSDGKSLPSAYLRREDETLRASLKRDEVGRALVETRTKLARQQGTQLRDPVERTQQNAADMSEVAANWQLLIDNTPAPIVFSARPDDALRKLQAVVPGTLNPTCDGDLAASTLPQGQTPKCDELILTASNPRTNWLMLRTAANDARTDLLRGHLQRVTRRVRLRRSELAAYAAERRLSSIELNDISLCSTEETCRTLTVQDVPRTLENADRRLLATIHSLDQLALTSRSGSEIQLRSKVGSPETNILNQDIEWVRPNYLKLDAAISPGTLLTWILLSLGAPFWYEMLKDTLKLRPALAQREEAQRKERQDDTTKTAGAGQTQK